MRVLVDTSVWVAHFKRHNERLARLLEQGDVLCHPYVVVEIAGGTPHRSAVIDLLEQLEHVPVATHEELLTFIERRRLQGRGCGFVDLCLMASTILGDSVSIWTLDKRLDAIAVALRRSCRQVNH